MAFPKPYVPEWYYRFMVKSTNATTILMMVAGSIGAVVTLIAHLRGSEIYDLWGVLFCLAFTLAAFLFRKAAFGWYRLMYRLAHGAYPNE